MALRLVLLALLGAATAASFATGWVIARNERSQQVAAADANAIPPAIPRTGDSPDTAEHESPVRAAPPGDAEYKEKVLLFLQKYCVDCHKGEKAKGGLALDGYVTEAAARKDRKNWDAIQHVTSTGEMPPKASKKPQPTKEEREHFVAWISNSLTKANCSPDTPKDPGRVTVRRLNRAEYNNTIRDLCGVDFKPAEEFPSDDVGYGFDNIGDVLSFQPILLEKYLAAADKILNAALSVPAPPKLDKQTFRPQQITAIPRSAKSRATGPKGRQIDRIVFSSEGSAFLPQNYNFTAEGEYVIRFRGWGTKVAGEFPTAVIRVDGKDVKSLTVSADPDKPQTYEARAKFSAGGKRVAVAFTNAFEDKDNKKSRELGIETIEVEGPFDPVPLPDPASVKLLLVARPGPGVDARAAAEKVLTNFARRAYRRPVKPDEVSRLVKLFDLATQQGEGFHNAVKLPMKAVLVSPHFLYRIEDDPKNPNDVRTISDFEFATRLSYFLWSSMPDEELFALAAKGSLRKPGVLDAQVKRMLKDPKSRALSENFAGQWLQLRNLKTLAPDKGYFPGWDDALRNSMVKEAELFFEYVVQNDRPILDFLDADYTFVDGRLAEHYGIKDVKSAEFRKVTLPDNRRGGIITMASTLTVTSNPTRTSPVKRGKWILENVLGTPPPPPAPDVPELPPTGQLKGTLREQMEQHRANPSCAVCHAKLDPLGFGLENFDGIGGWRTQDNKKPVDASGELPGGAKFNGPGELRKVLLGKADQFRSCFAEKLLTFGLGRGLEYYDKCSLDAITKASKAKGDTFSALVLAVVTSDPFQKRKGKRSE